MKKIFIILALFFTGMSAFADDIILKGEAKFDWVDITQVERDANIEYYKGILFDNNVEQTYSKDEFKQKFAPFKKDKDYKEHYRLAKMGQTETENANLCAFSSKNDILLVYAIQYKDNPRNVYYYNAYGHLWYVDDISENYPEFPYSSRQYRTNGKLVSAIYFISHDMQYMYEPDGTFKGLWYKEKMYDKNGKQKVTRSNWDI